MAATLFASESPAGKILAYLQRHGEATVKQLEELLGISTTAVREHLTHLEAKNLVTTKLVRRGPGRPHALYFLTNTAGIVSERIRYAFHHAAARDRQPGRAGSPASVAQCRWRAIGRRIWWFGTRRGVT